MMGATIEIIEDAFALIDEFTVFAGTIGETADDVFDAGLAERLRQIDDLARMAPGSVSHLKRYCFEMLTQEMDQGVICCHARHKPYGYAGDFRLIDGIYEDRTCSEGRGELWDRFFLRQPAAQAVRNRKLYILEVLSSLAGKGKTIALDLAGGPCREIYDFLCGGDGMMTDIQFSCVDNDEHAVRYARSLLGTLPELNGSIQFDTNNVFRFRPEHQYRLIWCAGLFDYLNDRMAVGLLKRIWRWLENGGRAVVGNFHPSNHTRNLMEWMCDWPLIHRTKEQMADLARIAGIPVDAIYCESEPLGINVFLNMEKP